MQKNKLGHFVKIIRADLYRYQGANGIRGFIDKYLHKPSFRYVFWMRLSAYLYGRKKFLLPFYIISNWWRCRLEIKYGISIPFNTQIGHGLFIGHFGGIVVNENAIIGRNCNLSHGVTIGQKNRGHFKGVPIIGDAVYIGPGAVIIGSVSVGSNVAIGANAVVVDNIKDNEVVVGNPARVVSSKGSESYVNWVFNE
jgi:serine O-acetyltransferase